MPDGWPDFADNLVWLLCLLPLLGIVLVAMVSRCGGSAVRRMAALSVLLSCGVSLPMLFSMRTAGPRFRMVSVHRWLAAERHAEPPAREQSPDRSSATPRLRTIGPDIRLAVGVDKVSLWPIVLTSLLMVPIVILGRRTDPDHPALHYSLLLLFQSAATSLFAALDIVLFCVCFELTILPLFVLIGHWGGAQRRPVVRQLFVRQLTGSLFVLLGLMGVVVTFWWMRSDAFGSAARVTFSIPQLLSGERSAPGLILLAATNPVARSDWNQFGPWLFLLLSIGFLIRSGLFPFHGALPSAVREAPPVARVLLLGIVPLFSLYGCARFLLPIFPAQSAELGGTISAVAIVGLVFTASAALAETDAIKRITLVAVGLFELSLAGLFLRTPLGAAGGTVQMLSAGLSVGLLLLLLEVGHPPGQSGALSGTSGRSQPRRRALLLFAMLAVIGAPGLSGFSGEILSLLAIFQQSGRWAISTLVGLFLGTWAVLQSWPTDLLPHQDLPSDGSRMPGSEAKRRTLKTRHGTDRGLRDRGTEDLTLRECAAIAPIVVAIIWIGVHPQFFADRIAPAHQKTTSRLTSPQNQHQQTTRQLPCRTKLAAPPFCFQNK